MDEMKDDPVVIYTILGFIIVLIGWLVYEHTGTGKDIQAVYWAGVVTPLLPQIAKQVFNLTKKNG